jgi:hypothetical protein
MYRAPASRDVEHLKLETAEFFREKANQCRAMAAGLADTASTARGLNALALELDAHALAIEAGRATARELEPGEGRLSDGNGSTAK